MNKAELAAVLADKCGVTKKQAEDMLDCTTKTITNKIKAGAEVTLTGFGTFSARVRKGRVGVNPQNPSQPIDIPPTKVVKFKAGKTLKDALKASQHVEASEPETVEEAPVTQPVEEAPVTEEAPAEPTESEPTEF